MNAGKRATAVVISILALGALAPTALTACGEDTDDDIRTTTSRPEPSGTITTTIPEPSDTTITTTDEETDE